MVVFKGIRKAMLKGLFPCALVLLLLPSITASSVQAETIKLWPLSATEPKQVYAVWENINRLLLSIVEENFIDQASIDQIKALEIKKVSDKRPRDVLGKVNEFRKILDKLRKDIRLPPTSLSRDLSGKDMQPKTVFLNSLLVLDSLQEWERLSFLGPIDAAEYYSFDIGQDRVPAEVFAKVDLAIRQLTLIAQTQQ